MQILHIKYLNACISTDEMEYIKNHIPKRHNDSLYYKSNESRVLSLLSGIMIYNNIQVDENTIKYNKLKKPYIENGPYFNVSHSNDIVVFAKSEKPIGIDAEIVNKKNMNILDYAFNEDEKSYINKCIDDFERAERLIELWTIKECLFKASGSAYYIEPKNIDSYEFLSKRVSVDSNDVSNNRLMRLDFNIKNYFYGTTKFLNELYNVYSFKYLNYYISIASVLKYDFLSFEKDKIIH